MVPGVIPRRQQLVNSPGAFPISPVAEIQKIERGSISRRRPQEADDRFLVPLFRLTDVVFKNDEGGSPLRTLLPQGEVGQEAADLRVVQRPVEEGAIQPSRRRARLFSPASRAMTAGKISKG